MKICPTCGRSFPAEDVYCPDDGAALSGYLPREDRVVVSLEQPGPEIETQWVRRPTMAPPGPTDAHTRSASGLMYGLVGGLVAVVLLLAIYILVTRRAEQPADSPA